MLTNTHTRGRSRGVSVLSHIAYYVGMWLANISCLVTFLGSPGARPTAFFAVGFDLPCGLFFFGILVFLSFSGGS